MFEHLSHLDFSHLFGDTHHFGLAADDGVLGNGPDELDPLSFPGQIHDFLKFDRELEKKLQTVADPDGILQTLHAKFHTVLAEFQNSPPGAHRDVLKARLDGIRANLSQRLGI